MPIGGRGNKWSIAGGGDECVVATVRQQPGQSHMLVRRFSTLHKTLGERAAPANGHGRLASEEGHTRDRQGVLPRPKGDVASRCGERGARPRASKVEARNRSVAGGEAAGVRDSSDSSRTRESKAPVVGAAAQRVFRWARRKKRIREGDLLRVTRRRSGRSSGRRPRGLEPEGRFQGHNLGQKRVSPGQIALPFPHEQMSLKRPSQGNKEVRWQRRKPAQQRVGDGRNGPRVTRAHTHSRAEAEAKARLELAGKSPDRDQEYSSVS